MPKKMIATQEAVATAVESLIAEGLEPTLERVRAKLGGGSYTTINRALAEVVQARQAGHAKTADIPADLMEIGQKAVAAVYSAVQKQTMATIEALEVDARRQVESAQAARAEAALEVERLERELESSGEELEQARRLTQEVGSRAERAEARNEAQQTEATRLNRDLATARSETDAVRALLREAEAQARKAEQDARQENQTLQRSLAKAEATLDAAGERQKRDADTVAQLRAELDESRRAATAVSLKAERAEASLAVHEETLSALRTELNHARDAERLARVEAAELRGQLRSQPAAA